jgi:hypothetical protein
MEMNVYARQKLFSGNGGAGPYVLVCFYFCSVICDFSLNVVIEWLAFLLIHEICGSNPSPEIGYPGVTFSFCGSHYICTCRIIRFEVFMVVRMKMLFFWVLEPCQLVGRCQCFGETFCLLQP